MKLFSLPLSLSLQDFTGSNPCSNKYVSVCLSCPSHADRITRSSWCRIPPLPPLVSIRPVKRTGAVRRLLRVIMVSHSWRCRGLRGVGERGNRFLPTARSCLRVGLHSPSHRPHRTVKAGIVENAMATIHPAAEALQNLLRSDVFFTASWIGHSVEEIFRDLR